MTTEYLLYNTVTHETITLCDDDDGACISALQEKGFYMLLESRYGDKYQYPAIYKSPGIVWDQSEEKKTNGDWTMTSRAKTVGDTEEDLTSSEESTTEKISPLKYILYNSKTHESYSVPDELSGSGFVILNENTYPDYSHPAVYNTTTHTAIDQGESSNISGDWMMLSKYKDSFTSSAASVKSVVSGDSIASFRLSEPVEMSDKEISMCIIGTEGKDKIIGADTSEILIGSSGKNTFTGGDNSDGFMFDSKSDFGKKVADKIRDFDADEGDHIMLDKSMFGLGKKLKFKSVSGRAKANNASETNKQIIYDENKGRLYFNENGSEDGWGDGGYFAKLSGTPELNSDSFMIV